MLLAISVVIAKITLAIIGGLVAGGYRIIWVLVHHYKLAFFSHAVFRNITSILLDLQGMLAQESIEPNKRNLAFDYLSLHLLVAKWQLRKDIEKISKVGIFGTDLTKVIIEASLVNRAVAFKEILQEQNYPSEVLSRFEQLTSVIEGILSDSVVREIANNKMLITPKLLLDIYFVNVSQFLDGLVRRQFPAFLAMTNGVFKRYAYTPYADGFLEKLVIEKVNEVNSRRL